MTSLLGLLDIARKKIREMELSRNIKKYNKGYLSFWDEHIYIYMRVCIYIYSHVGTHMHGFQCGPKTIRHKSGKS